jgi:hypothetical protein
LERRGKEEERGGKRKTDFSTFTEHGERYGRRRRRREGHGSTIHRTGETMEAQHAGMLFSCLLR